MPQPRYYVGVYWYPGQAADRGTADRLLTTLERLGEVHPAFTSWHLDEDRPVTGRDDLQDAVLAGKGLDRGDPALDRADSGLSLISRVEDPDSATLSAVVEGSTQAFPRSVVVEPTFVDRGSDAWERALPRVLQVLVDVWSPEWGVAGTSAADDALQGQAPGLLDTPANLLTWVPGQAPAGLPPEVTTRPLAGGVLMDVDTPDGAEAHRRVTAVARALAQAGRRLAAHVPSP